MYGLYGVLFMLDMYLFIHATSDKSLGHLILIYHDISWSIYESSRSPKTMLTADLYPWTFSLAKGCKRLQSLAQRSSPWSLRLAVKVLEGSGWVQDGYMMGWLIKHLSGFLISAFFRSVDLLWSCCKDSMIRPGEAAFGGGERCSGAFWIWAAWDGRERREPPCGCAFPDGSLSCAGNCCRVTPLKVQNQPLI